MPDDDKPQPPAVPIDLTPEASKVLTHWIDSHYATRSKKGENKHQEIQVASAALQQQQTRSFWLLVGVLIAIAIAAALLYWIGSGGDAALLLTHAMTFAAGWGTHAARQSEE